MVDVALDGDGGADSLAEEADDFEVAMALVDWIQNRLPEIGRSYGDNLSRIESSVFLTLRYLRGVVVSAWLAVLGAGTVAPRLKEKPRRIRSVTPG